MDAAARRLYLMSFRGMGKSIQNHGAPIRRPAPGSSFWMSFQTGYSLTGCSPALPASASPAGVDHAAGLAQVGTTFSEGKMNTIALKIKTV
jgi:hypothetical protein